MEMSYDDIAERLLALLRRGKFCHVSCGTDEYGEKYEQSFETDPAKVIDVPEEFVRRFALPDLTAADVELLRFVVFLIRPTDERSELFKLLPPGTIVSCDDPQHVTESELKAAVERIQERTERVSGHGTTE